MLTYLNMTEIDPDYQFLFAFFSMPAGISFFVVSYFTLRIMYFVLVKNNPEKYRRSALGVWISLFLMFWFWGVAFNVQYLRATTFAELNYWWGAIGSFIGSGIALVLIVFGYIYQNTHKMMFPPKE